ncbi:TIGR03089 family protein [Nocardioides panacis]|uniref:TIGR03089 family protein n=1 Tax=Nocardioides panacis TaxID=2849501 RepID=A0A975SVN9_9ACTN|nr:TIGR03089 family protein [Nocardioides panacis]QWZ06767.1 TIGR03089 family protein [Nocardioides panacis]
MRAWPPPSPPTFPAALAALLRSDPSRPLVTFYDDATGERIELSVTTYANWVAKTAGLATDELDAERGGLVLVDLPTHWQGAVWLGAAWSVGLTVTDDPALAGRADLVVCGPDRVAAYASLAERVPVVALSLRPLGGRFAEPLPAGVTDYGAVVLAQPDVFVAYDPPTGDDVAWRDAEGTSTQADLLAGAAGVVTAGGRLLTDVNPCTRAGLATVLGPLVAGAGVAWVRHPDGSGWDRRAEQERATDLLRRAD